MSNTSVAEVLVEQADYIPYACHLDDATLLTKNGELLQIFKIEGYQFDSAVDGKRSDLRLEIRQILQSLLLEPHFCVTLHMVRRRRNLSAQAMKQGGFAAAVEQKWNELHQWQNGYSNDLYVTITHEGSDFSFADVGQMFRSFFFLAEKMKQRRHLDKMKERLTKTVDECLKALGKFSPRKLVVVEENGTAYSEPLSLINHLLNLEHAKKMPMPVSDISDYMVAYPVDIGFNSIEVKHSNGQFRYASIFSIKQYSELRPGAVDAFLQYPAEFIITQQIMFGARPDFISLLERKKHMAELGEDKDLIRFSGTEDMLASNNGVWSDYTLQQNTIMIMADSSAQLESTCSGFMAALNSVGTVAVREDIMLEDIYYSQLPGNFEFLRRQQPINTIRAGGYTTLYDFPTGKFDGNLWGSAITVLRTTQRNPYFFSFHQGDNGHTIIAGPYGSGKTALLNFLMTQTERLEPRVIWLDTHHNAEIYVRAISGGYTSLVRNKESVRRPMNPFKLPDTKENRQFLQQWFQYLLLDMDGNMAGNPDIDFAEVVETVFALAPEKRQLSSLSLNLPEPFSAYFQQWVGSGRYSHLFDNKTDEIFSGARIDAFDITEMVQDRRPLWATLSYIMYRSLQALDGRPTIFVLDEAWGIFDNPVFSSQLPDWLDQMQKNNALAILATENLANLPLSTLTPEIVKRSSTQFLFPDSEVTENLQELMNLSTGQYRQFLSMEKGSQHIFLKQGSEFVIINMQLPQMPGMLEVLLGQPMDITRMENIIAKVGASPEQWLPEFYKQN